MSYATHHDLSGDRITVANDAARLAWNDTLEALQSTYAPKLAAMAGGA